jgi:hypothetical protein
MDGPEPVRFRVRQFFRFQKEELKHLLISILAVTFIFAFNDKSQAFNLAYWVSNFIIIMLIVTATFFVHVSAQKVAALKVGYIAEYRMWTTGLVIGVVIALLSGGKWYVLLPGGIFIQHMAIQRLGKFRYGLNVASMAPVAAAGPIANIVLATFAVAMSRQLHILPQFFDVIATVNFWFAIFMLLPLPRMPGLYVFFFSRLTYVFIFTTILTYIILTRFEIYSWIFSILSGAACWFLYYMIVERNVRVY